MGFMRSILAATATCVFATAAMASECPGKPDAIGTARTIAVDSSERPRVGTMQYSGTLPLADKEVVLTFDDGPLPPYSERILDILSAECVKATFFIVGKQARLFPDTVRRAYDAGHTIATHSQNHPRAFHQLATSRIIEEIEEGIAWTGAALGDHGAVAPFFRVPGLRTSSATESYLTTRGVMVWSADVPSDDWRGISVDQVVQRSLDRLDHKGKGILLLHDIQPVTALALPELLRELKVRGYRIVHVTTAPERPKPLGTPGQWVLRGPGQRAWPRVMDAPQLPVPSPQSFGWPDVFQAKDLVATKTVQLKLTRRNGYQTVRIVEANWPAHVPAPLAAADALPAPSPLSFGVPHPSGPHITLPAPGKTTRPVASEQSSDPLQPIAWPQSIPTVAPLDH
jgi:peptidoglycan/xylan/chitin deacetylase (PgdA/CDA1 family)